MRERIRRTNYSIYGPRLAVRCQFGVNLIYVFYTLLIGFTPKTRGLYRARVGVGAPVYLCYDYCESIPIEGESSFFPVCTINSLLLRPPVPLSIVLLPKVRYPLLHPFLTSVTPVCSTNGNRYGSLAKTFIKNEWTGFSNR